LEGDFWDKHSKDMESWQEEGRTFYRVAGPDVGAWQANQCLWSDGEDGIEAVVHRVGGDHAVIELVHDYRNPRTPSGESTPATASRTSRSTC
jgi:PhoH-like ATPase